MQRDGIAVRLQAFIRDDLLCELDADVALDDDLLAEGLLDSLAVVRLVAFIDEELGIAVPPEHITVEHFASVDAMARYLDTLC